LQHNPRYAQAFANPLYKLIWFRAFGLSAYSRLAFSRQNSIRLATTLVLHEDSAGGVELPVRWSRTCAHCTGACHVTTALLLDHGSPAVQLALPLVAYRSIG
jgi:hypothetical protein